MDTNFKGLIERAASGDKHAMHELILKVQPRLRAYIMRCTLNEDLSEDLLQETMMQMMTSLSSLENPERIWPWLYRVASNKIASHFRKSKRRAAVQFSSLEEHLLDSVLKDESQDVSERPVLKELNGIVLKAIEKLSGPQRAVLSLRCFDDMPYSEISETVGCSESAARVHFLRARKELKTSLKRQGITGKAVLLALVLFGKHTAGEALAASVTPASVVFESGLTAAEMALLALKSRLLKIGSAAAVLLLGVYLFMQLGSGSLPSRELVNSVHYMIQGVGFSLEQPRQVSLPGEGAGGSAFALNATFEQWLQFPAGVDGPVRVRMQRWTFDQAEKQCAWLQDGIANYYYNCVDNTIHLTNDPIEMLILPTDSAEMADFILEYSDYLHDMDHHHDRKTGLLTACIDNRIGDVPDYTTRYKYNTLSDDDFEPFWPENATVVDQRDRMHQRGWTYFTLRGNVGGVEVTGRGQMPLRYSMYEYYQPWVEMNIGGVVEIIDTPEGAVLKDLVAGQTEHYRSGTFFMGLGRPWSGIRAYDTVRRDAARKRIPFSSHRIGEQSTVILNKESGYAQLQLVYHIDMAKDLIEAIHLKRDGEGCQEGTIVFDYAQSLEDWGEVFEQPALPEATVDQNTASEDTFWAVWLLEQIPAMKQVAVKNNH